MQFESILRVIIIYIDTQKESRNPEKTTKHCWWSTYVSLARSALASRLPTCLGFLCSLLRHINIIKLGLKGAQTCALPLFCDRDLEINLES